MVKIKQVVANLEGEQVPTKEEHEADKDFEQRLAKVCAWLIDQYGVTFADFDLKQGSIYWESSIELIPRKAYSGSWIIAGETRKPSIYGDWDIKNNFVVMENI